jgi:RNA polymerase sigma factor (sigma-70 family)
MAFDSPSQQYTLAAYHRNERKQGKLPCDKDEFLKAVAGEVLVLLNPDRSWEVHKPLDARQQEAKLKNFEQELDLALQGAPATAFKNHPLRPILKKAIANAIKLARTPPRTKRKHETLAKTDEVVTSSPEPSAAAIIAEEIANVQRTVKREIKDQTDKAILRLRFFRCMTKRDIAQTLELSEATVRRRLEKIYKRLRGQPEFQSLVELE